MELCDFKKEIESKFEISELKTYKFIRHEKHVDKDKYKLI